MKVKTVTLTEIRQSSMGGCVKVKTVTLTEIRQSSMGGCVKVKTVTLTEIRQSSVRNNILAERVYLVLNSFWHWVPVERLKLRNVVSFAWFLFCF